MVQVGEHDGQPLMVLVGGGRDPEFLIYEPAEVGDEARDDVRVIAIRHGSLQQQYRFDVPEVNEDSVIELRPYTGQRLYIDGQPASGAFE